MLKMNSKIKSINYNNNQTGRVSCDIETDNGCITIYSSDSIRMRKQEPLDESDRVYEVEWVQDLEDKNALDIYLHTCSGIILFELTGQEYGLIIEHKKQTLSFTSVG